MERLLFHRGRFSIVAGETRLILGNLLSATSPGFLWKRLSHLFVDLFVGAAMAERQNHMLRQLYVPQRVSWNFFGNVAVVPDDFPGDTRWP